MKVQVADFEDYQNIVKPNYGKSKPRISKSLLSNPLYCPYCGLEGCNKHNHNWDFDENQRAMGVSYY